MHSVHGGRQQGLDVFTHVVYGRTLSRVQMQFTNDPYKDIQRFGEETNARFESKFIPLIKQQALTGALEMGDAMNYNISNWTFDAPKIGDAKKTFAHYRDELLNVKV